MHIAQPLDPYSDMKNLGNHNKDSARFFIRSTNQYVALCIHEYLQDLGRIHTTMTEVKDPMGKKKKQAKINSKQTVSESFETILRHNLNLIPRWETAARSWEDIEGVHQMRVSFRRLRSALSAFRSAVPRQASISFAEELRWLGNQLGLARDLDVFIDEGLSEIGNKLPLAGKDKMDAIVMQHREVSYEAVRTMLDGDRYVRFKNHFLDWLDNKAWEQQEIEPKHYKRLDSKIVPFARQLLNRLEHRVQKRGKHVDRESAEEMHRLRIECKKLRYAAEFFLPLFKGMNEFITHMKGLQDLLGKMNDVSVMQHLLDRLLADVSDPEIIQYAGGLVGWRACDYDMMLGSFNDRWEEFANANHPWSR